MSMEIFENGQWLPLAFAGLMGLSMLIYAVLDGYDLGVGMLMRTADDDQKDTMIASIGPFWDANETWLVLGVGILLVAFPVAHGVILQNLYVPVALMLVGLIMRGVAFDFRAKARDKYKSRWNRTFFAGSLLAALSQGYMLGNYILGFEKSAGAFLFSALVGVCVAAGYCLIGACWLIMKTEGDLQLKAIAWARRALVLTVGGIGLVSLATPLVSTRIFEKWFSMPEILFLAPVPLATGGLVIALWLLLLRMPLRDDRRSVVPFFMTIGIYVLCFGGLAYSFFPYIIPDQMLIVESASAPQSLMIIFIGAIVVLPFLIGYTALAYHVFRGKATSLRYD